MYPDAVSGGNQQRKYIPFGMITSSNPTHYKDVRRLCWRACQMDSVGRR